ncbi:WD40-repeat-containing domain protein [Chytriomyces sp. MP71]|nr:WD40-repeat-containing domain protein [Chytriomyces sp. MP71]
MVQSAFGSFSSVFCFASNLNSLWLMADPIQVEGDQLTREMLQSYAIAKAFKLDKVLTCLDFDSSGELCLVTCEDELRMYDCLSGVHKKTSYSKKYGCEIAKFTHRKQNILYSSTKEDDAIRYLSFHDNKFLRYFVGHTSRVTAIEMCPQDDQFMSASLDGEVRLWDLKSGQCTGILKTDSHNPRIAFDPQGMIFAVSTNSSAIRLFDIKKLSEGPFATFSVPTDLMSGAGAAAGAWTTLKFSNDGKWLLLGNRDGALVAIDSFDCKVLWQFSGRPCGAYKGPVDMDAVITPDGNFVLGGSDDGIVHVWDAPPVIADAPVPTQPTILKSVAQLRGSKGDPCSLIKFNPRYSMFASANDKTLCFWLPSSDA